MVWGGILCQEMVDVVGIDRKIDSEYYINFLRTVLLPVADTLLYGY